MISTTSTRLWRVPGETDIVARWGGSTAELPGGQTHDEGTLVLTPGNSISGVVDFAEDADTVSMTLAAGTYMVSLIGSGACRWSILPQLDRAQADRRRRRRRDQFADHLHGGDREDLHVPGRRLSGYGITGGYRVHLEKQRRRRRSQHARDHRRRQHRRADLRLRRGPTGDVDIYRACTLTARTFYNFAGRRRGRLRQRLAAAGSRLDTVLTVYDAAGDTSCSAATTPPGDELRRRVFRPKPAGPTPSRSRLPQAARAALRAARSTQVDLATLRPACRDRLGRGRQRGRGPVAQRRRVLRLLRPVQARPSAASPRSAGPPTSASRSLAAWNTYSTFADVRFAVTANQSRGDLHAGDAAGRRVPRLVQPAGTESEGPAGSPSTARAGIAHGSTGGLEAGELLRLVHAGPRSRPRTRPARIRTTRAAIRGPARGDRTVRQLRRLRPQPGESPTVMSFNDGWPLHPDAPARRSTMAWAQSAAGHGVRHRRWCSRSMARSPATPQHGLPARHRQRRRHVLPVHLGHRRDRRSATVARPARFIDLTAATLDYSPTGGGVIWWVDGILGDYTIAHGVVIENAKGGGGDVSITGNASRQQPRRGSTARTRWSGSAVPTRSTATAGSTRSTAGPATTFSPVVWARTS